jgi:hypothetical protein
LTVIGYSLCGRAAIDYALMARYRIHRIRESIKEQFRWAPHTGGTAVVKPKDYCDVESDAEAATPYALWSRMRAQGKGLFPGDLLETVREDGTPADLQVFKYIGFEPAKWWIAEPKPEQKIQFDGAQTPVALTAHLHSD